MLDQRDDPLLHGCSLSVQPIAHGFHSVVDVLLVELFSRAQDREVVHSPQLPRSTYQKDQPDCWQKQTFTASPFDPSKECLLACLSDWPIQSSKPCIRGYLMLKNNVSAIPGIQCDTYV